MEDEQRPVEPPARRAGLLLPALSGCAGGLLGVLIGGALALLAFARMPSIVAPLAAAPTPLPSPTPVLALAAQPAGPADLLRDAPARVARDVGPAVVTVVSQLPSQSSFFGSYQPPPARGSGVIVDPRGYIITNNHVIEGAEQLYVVLADGRQKQATLVGTDYPFSDLALVKIEGDSYPAARLGGRAGRHTAGRYHSVARRPEARRKHAAAARPGPPPGRRACAAGDLARRRHEYAGCSVGGIAAVGFRVRRLPPEH